MDVDLLEIREAQHGLGRAKRISQRRHVPRHRAIAKGNQDAAVAPHSLDHLKMIVVLGNAHLDQDQASSALQDRSSSSTSGE